MNNKGVQGSADKQYSTMSVHELCQMPVQDLMLPDSILFMWWLASMPREALQVVTAWGYQLKTMTGFTWVKLSKNYLRFFGLGFWTRQGSESCLIATRGKFRRADDSVPAVYEDSYYGVLGKHSAKPDEFRKRICVLCGNLPRIELFARERVEGWDAWGNEV
jgi:N6-adenosine-specific RNA methylase IME4